MAVIRCSISNCSHNESGSSCGLSEIVVGAHVAEPKAAQETDCQSFDLK